MVRSPVHNCSVSYYRTFLRDTEMRDCFFYYRNRSDGQRFNLQDRSADIHFCILCVCTVLFPETGRDHHLDRQDNQSCVSAVPGHTCCRGAVSSGCADVSDRADRCLPERSVFQWIYRGLRNDGCYCGACFRHSHYPYCKKHGDQP